MLDYDVSMHILVVLVVVILTSPRSSKTEFVCKRYCVSRVCASGIPASSELSGIFRSARNFPEHSGRIPNLRRKPSFRTDSEQGAKLSVRYPEYSGPFRIYSG